MRLVIAITGTPLSGKETCSNVIQECLAKDGFSVKAHTFSEILRETLDLWNIPHGRANEQTLAIIMNAETGFKDGALSRAMEHRLLKDAEDVGVLDGIRWRGDERMIRGLADKGIASAFIYVTATPETRYERLIARNRSGEANTTWETFMEQEKARTEVDIPDIGSRAEIKLTNDYNDLEKFRAYVKKAYDEAIKPLLK